MQLDPDWLMAQGEDAMLLHRVDTAFPETHQPDMVGIAVSGGGDSMALLHLFWRWSVKSGRPIAAVTVNHGLRPEAAEEAAHVAAFCAVHGIPHETLNWSGGGDAGNLQANARNARYRLIGDWARANAIGGVALGHTADDVAETFLLRLARKSGLDGLAAMDQRFERDGIFWTRPLWQVGRAELRDYLKRHKIRWCDDPSNEDERFDRIRARKALQALAPLGIDAETIMDSALNLQVARNTLDHFTREAARARVVEDRGDLLLQTGGDAGSLRPEIKRRILTAAMRWCSGAEYAPRYTAMLEMDATQATAKKHTLSGCLLTRGDTAIRVTREYNAVRAATCPTTEVWDGRWQLDGPHADDLHIAALGVAVKDCPDWRETGLPRASLMASPAVWQDGALIAAPLAGYNPDWTARIVTSFASYLLSH